MLKDFLFFSKVYLDLFNFCGLRLFLWECELELLNKEIHKKAVIGYQAHVFARMHLGALADELLNLMTDLLVLASVQAGIWIHRAGFFDLAFGRRCFFVLISSSGSRKICLGFRVDVVQDFFD